MSLQHPDLDWPEDRIRATFHPAVNAVISKHGWKLDMVPMEHRTPHVCRHFVHRAYDNLAAAPFRCRRFDNPTCVDAVSRDGLALQWCIEPTKALCIAAVKKTSLALSYVPSHLRDADVCQAALEGGAAELEFIWDDVPDAVLPELERRGIKKPDFEARNVVPF